jgi:hypothetical protein
MRNKCTGTFIRTLAFMRRNHTYKITPKLKRLFLKEKIDGLRI